MSDFIKFKHLLCMLAVAVLSGCNSDIFVEDTGPVEDSVVIEGDGGSHTVRIQTKGLERVFINLYGSYYCLTYYNKAGDVVPGNSPVTEVARINYTTIWCIADLFIEGDRLIFQSTENADNQAFMLPVVLDYGYKIECIEWSLLPGKQMELADLHFDMGQLVDNPEADARVSVSHIANNGALPTRVDIRPYHTAQAWFSLIVYDSLGKGFYGDIHAPLPTMVDGRWQLVEPEWSFKMHSKQYYWPSGIDRMLTIPVEVPPESKVDVETVVTYASAEVPFVAKLRNPVSGRELWSMGKCSVYEPVSYEINVKKAE